MDQLLGRRLTDTPGRGVLTVVGTGIDGAAHMTPEARAALADADEVVYLAAEPVAARLIERLHPRARSLAGHYGAARPRQETYDAIVEDLVAPLGRGVRLCAAFYGHPGLLVDAAHRAIARARAEGHTARMLPAVSALDCLVADLGLDPARSGLQTHDATWFLLLGRRPDPTVPLVLWQPDVVGERLGGPDGKGSRLPLLVERLRDVYPADHETIVYMASPYAIAEPFVARVPLGELVQEALPPAPLLVVPPLVEAPVDPVVRERLAHGPGASEVGSSEIRGPA